MNTKICTKCLVEKNRALFNKDRTRKDGKFSWCKKCVSEDKKRIQQTKIQVNPNFSIIKKCCTCKQEKNGIDFYVNKKESDGLGRMCKICKRKADKLFYSKNISKIKKKNKQAYQINREQRLIRNKNNRQDPIFISKEKERSKIYRTKNKEIIQRKKKNYYQENKKLIHKKLLYKRHNDINFRLHNNMRSRLSHALQKNSKGGKTIEYIGCSIEEFKKHIESKWLIGMTWDNYGKNGWHIDHIVPCCRFDFSIEDEIKKCFHFSNMQPLWAIDNMRKNKY